MSQCSISHIESGSLFQDTLCNYYIIESSMIPIVFKCRFNLTWPVNSPVTSRSMSKQPQPQQIAGFLPRDALAQITCIHCDHNIKYMITVNAIDISNIFITSRGEKPAIDSRTHFPDRSCEISRDLTNLREILLDGPNRFGKATLNESVPSLGRRWHRLVYATRRYNYVGLIAWNARRSSAQPSAWPDDRLVCTSYNALGNSASQLQRCCRQRPYSTRRHHCHVSTTLNGTAVRIRTLRCMLIGNEYSGRKDCRLPNIGYLRGKFPRDKLSRKNLVRIIRYSRLRAMP